MQKLKHAFGAKIIDICLDDDGALGLGERGDVNGPYPYINAIGAIKYGTYGSDELEAFEEALHKADDILSHKDNRDADKILKLFFLKQSIFILRETERRFIDKPEHLQNLIKLYWDTYDSAQSEIQAAMALDVYERYLVNLCFDDANQDWFDLKGISREKEVENAVRGLLKMKARDVTLRQNKDFARRQEMVLEKSKEWLLSRYNLAEASKVVFEKEELARVIFMWLPEWLAVAMIIWLIKGPPEFMPNFDRNLVIGFLYFVIFLSGISWFLNGGSSKNIRLLLPRLAAGIVVGYFFLLTYESWRGIFDSELGFLGDGTDCWLTFARIVLPLFCVLIYIRIEISHVPGIVNSLWKPCHILVKGASYSILTGVVFSDIFGELMIRSDPGILTELTGSEFQGFFGTIYPEVIFYLAPLALFIGVFVQLLWQDKALTEKI